MKMVCIGIIKFHKFKASFFILHVYDEFHVQCLECFSWLSLSFMHGNAQVARKCRETITIITCATGRLSHAYMRTRAEL